MDCHFRDLPDFQSPINDSFSSKYNAPTYVLAPAFYKQLQRNLSANDVPGE